jgi:hypothetical protein
MRSVQQYANWFRRIYLITNGQIPYWLKTECSRIKIVTHEVSKKRFLIIIQVNNVGICGKHFVGQFIYIIFIYS